MSTIPTYPSLSSHAGPLTEPSEVIPSILRHIFATPSVSSDNFENTAIPYKASFRKLEAEYGHDPDLFIANFRTDLMIILVRYFPQRTMSVDLTYQYIDESTNEVTNAAQLNRNNPRYVVYIDIQDVTDDTSNPVFISGQLNIDHSTGKFNIRFEDTNK